MSIFQRVSTYAIHGGVAVTVLLAGVLSAEAEHQTRSVKTVNSAAGSELRINQIDTSKFPKVHIFASVLKDSAAVSGLGADDFRVREDEVDQEPLTVVPKVAPLSLMLALDVSGSMKKAMPAMQGAASGFVDSLSQDDTVTVIGFAREVKQVLSATPSKSAVKRAIESTVARGDTALYDALFDSLESLRSVPGRRAVVLLSDGVDDDGYGGQLSRRSFSEILDLAREVNVPVFTIGLGSAIDEETLSTVAKRSGGKYLSTASPEALAELYQSIGRELSGQYEIFYNSNLPGDGSLHRIQLSQGELRSVKEYRSPSSTANSRASIAVPEQKPLTAESKKPTSFKGLGIVTLPGLSVGQEVKVTRAGKSVGEFRYNIESLRLPSGPIELQFGEYTYPLEVKSREDVAPVGRLSLPISEVHQRVQVSRDGKKIHEFSYSISSLLLPPGSYELTYGKNLKSSVMVGQGQEILAPYAVLTLKGLSVSERVAVRQGDFHVGDFKYNASQFLVPPGEYELVFGGETVESLKVSAGDNLNLSE